jgi:DNA-binding transcriptional regulator YiaG
MSDWNGNNNPGHRRRLVLWESIESEFGEPIANVIQGLREQDGGNSWRTVAGALRVNTSTLQEWRKALGMAMNQGEKMFDPSSTPETTPTDQKAIALGYENAQDAVLEMRINKEMTIKQVAQELGIYYQTVVHYTPLTVRGRIYNRSDLW